MCFLTTSPSEEIELCLEKRRTSTDSYERTCNQLELCDKCVLKIDDVGRDSLTEVEKVKLQTFSLLLNKWKEYTNIFHRNSLGKLIEE